MLYEAFMAGTWASIGSTIGKLSGTPAVVVSIDLIGTQPQYNIHAYLPSTDTLKETRVV